MNGNLAADFRADACRGGSVAQNDHTGIISSERTENLGKIQLIERRASRLCKPGKRLEHDDILCIVDTGYALTEDNIELRGKCVLDRLCRRAVAVRSAGSQLLDDAQLLDVPGNGCLRGIEAAFLQLLQQLFLRLDVVVADQLEDFFVAFLFHGVTSACR